MPGRVQCLESSCWAAARPARGPAFCCALCTRVSALHKPDQASGCPSRPCNAAALMLRPSCSAHRPGAQSARVAATAAAEARPYNTQTHPLRQLSLCQLSSLCRYGHINGCTAGRSPAENLYGLLRRPWVQIRFEQRYKHYAWGLVQALTALSRPPASLTQDAVCARRAPSLAVQSTYPFSIPPERPP